MTAKHLPRGIKLSFRHKVWLYGSLGILFLSGIFWEGLKLSQQGQSQTVGRTLDLQVWLLKIHGAAAMAALIMLGTLIPVHIKRAWKAGISRKNGIFLLSVNLILIVTGYGLYYAGENIQNLSKILHVFFGILLPFVIVWHIAAGRRERKSKTDSR